jgi:Nickel responsive protein SCO4226-like
MQTYTIRRRNGWQTAEDLKRAAEKSLAVGDEMPADIRWIRSYVVQEDDGTLGTLCIYQASSPEAIRRHAEVVGMPATEINLVGDTVLVRPDPEPVSA